MNPKLCIIAAVLALLLAAPTRAGFEEGLAAYQSGDYAKALEAWRPLAEQGDETAQHNIGVMYDKGKGVAQSDAEAMAWYLKAAEQGYDMAQFNLGAMFYNGQGVAQDFAEADRWIRRAAEQGHEQAQAVVASMIAENRAPPPNDDLTAAKWYRQAAEQGHALSQLRLGHLYLDGTGVPQSYQLAHMWFNLAASRLPSGGERDKARTSRDLVASKMTPAQVGAAQSLATKWWETHEAPDS